MNARHPARHPLLLATLVVSLPLALAGCGNKGPLVMAEEPAQIEAPPTPEGSVPVEIESPRTLPADAPVAPATDAPVDPRIPIDPATVPTGDTDSDSPSATGTVDDGNG